jgi:ABC-type protease/lipase transport system fused ATPase/permease subunit
VNVPARQASRPADLSAALRACSGAFVGIGLLSAVLNVLFLTGAFFMLTVYDRVVPSRSLPTLVAIAVLAFGLYFFQAILDVLRGRALVRIGAALDEALSGRIYDMIVRMPLKARASGDGLQPLRDFDQVRSYLSGLGPTALFDLPWIPFYLAICFVFHPLIGLTALAGSLILLALALLADLLATPRWCMPWACRAALPRNGARPMPATDTASDGPPTSRAGWAQFPRSCA